jgi:hypothetical protein
MAPIATLTPEQPPTAYVKKGTGDYKEQAGGLKEYNPQLEEEGEGKANVDVLLLLNSLNLSSAVHSIKIIFQPGIQMRNTLR